ncbi:MAG TPA: hypothetical protein VH560_01885 [Polyangia bacterium]|jgi:hypothetical protein|nr:hypothetical protein [Polyangia bacterium]
MAVSVRQGGTTVLRAPYARLGDIASVSNSSDVTAEPQIAADGSVVGVLLTARHGAPIGALGVDMKTEREVTITSASGGAAATRHVKVLVSAIFAVGPGGTPAGIDATNDGTLDQPFATFAKAASVAQNGDTIYLRNGASSVGVGNTADAPAITLQDGVTVLGNDNAGTIDNPQLGSTELTMEIDLVGGAAFSDVTLDGHRLIVTAPGSQLVLQNSLINEGITLDAKASIENAGARPTNLHVYGGSLANNSDVALSPLWVAADGATVTIEDGARVSTTELAGNGGIGPMTAAILFEGHAQTLTILDGAIVFNLNGPAIQLSGPADLEVGSATVEGDLDIVDPASTAHIAGTHFYLAENKGQIQFAGATLDIDNSDFTGLAVVQNYTKSHVKMRNSTVSLYAQVGYNLLAGTLDLGTQFDQGNNVFTSSMPTSGVLAPPTALIVESDGDGVAVTSSATSFDTVTPGMCELTAEHGWPGIVTITHGAKVDFF